MLCPFATHRIIPSATDPAIKPIGAILHVDAGNAASLYHWFNGPSKGIESHFHVRKDGHIEQYRDTEQEADANHKGNSFIRNGVRVGFISIETQGYASGEWTPEQLDSIKRLLVWAAESHPLFELRRVPGPYDPGVGYHSQWGAPGAWTSAAGKTCPGPDRIRQYEEIIVPWMEGRGEGHADTGGTETMLPIRQGDHDRGRRSDIAYWQHMINEAFGSHRLNPDGFYGVNMASRLVELGVTETETDPAVREGKVITGNVAGRIMAAVLRRQESKIKTWTNTKIAGAAAAGGATAAMVIQEIVQRLS